MYLRYIRQPRMKAVEIKEPVRAAPEPVTPEQIPVRMAVDAFGVLPDVLEQVDAGGEQFEALEEAMTPPEPRDTASYSLLTITELRKIAVDKGVKLPRNTSKAAIIELIGGHDEQN